MTDTFEERFDGVLLGQAGEDAKEIMRRARVRDKYPEGTRAYDQIFRDAHGKRWTRWDWTDDREQITLIFDSLLENRGVDLGMALS